VQLAPNFRANFSEGGKTFWLIHLRVRFKVSSLTFIRFFVKSVDFKGSRKVKVQEKLTKGEAVVKVNKAKGKCYTNSISLLAEVSHDEVKWTFHFASSWETSASREDFHWIICLFYSIDSIRRYQFNSTSWCHPAGNLRVLTAVSAFTEMICGIW